MPKKNPNPGQHGGPRPKVREDDRRGWNAQGGDDPHFASYEPNEEHRQTVKTYAVVMTQPGLAAMMGISLKTLRKYYAPEIAEAESKANAVAGGKMYQLVQQGFFPALKYWLERRAGWAQQIQIAGPDGGPIEHRDMSVFNDEQLDTIIRALELLTGVGGGEPPGGT